MHMQKMGTGDGADQKSFSGSFNKRGSRKSTRFDDTASRSSAGGSMRSNNKDDYIITLAVGEDDTLAVHSVETAEGVDVDDPESTLLGKELEKRTSFGRLVARSASAGIRHVSGELKKLASCSQPPIVDQSEPIVGQSDRTKSAAINGLTRLNFISTKTVSADGTITDPWEAVEEQYKKLTAKTTGLLPRALFGECIGMDKDSNDFAGELFDALSRRRNYKGYLINKTQMKEFWDQIVDESFDSRLQTFFDLVDKDANGQISKDEVQEIISLSASANKLSNIHRQADEYATMIMEELDRDGHGYILIEELESLLLQAPEESVRGDSKSLSIMLSKDLKMQRDSNIIKRGYNRMKYFLQDNWQRIWVIALWVGIMAGLFTYKYIQYKNRAAYDVMGHCVSIAKGAAETLKFNMALILLPVCRNTITWLRNKTNLGVVVPFADNINFHQLIAFGITIGTGLHAISHLACDFPRLLAATEEEYEPMVQYFGEQPNTYWHFVKGTEGWTGIAMVILMAIAFTLATPRLRNGKLKRPNLLMKSTLFNAFWKLVMKITGFNSFWYSHHLFIIVYGMLIVHGIKLYLTKEWYKKTTWMYLAVPVLLYACERLTRAIRSRVKPVKILKAAPHGVYPANMLELQMSKPPGFKYRSGQYMLVNCKAVAPFEWHPFSITSAPGDDYLSVHIRMVGDWTKQLKKVFSEVSQLPANGKSGPPKVKIDGPYGAPAQDYEKYDIVLLVGSGIGATPMVSIVKDIVNNMKAKQKEVEALESGNTSLPPASLLSKKHASNFKTTRAYFYWVTREQGSFDWFKDVLDEFAEAGYDNVIEMHNYCTSVYEKDDARVALITMLQSLNHAKNGVDVVSGTHVKSHFGRPDWPRVYRHIAASHTGQRIGVFYCGVPALGKDLKDLASEFSHTTTTKFEFHKEIF